MAGQTIRTASVYKALRAINNAANRCDERAELWEKQFGENDQMVLSEIVRAQAYREVVQNIAEALGIDHVELLKR